MKPSRVTIAAVLALLGGCGRVAELEPEAGQSLPVKPLMARTTPTADDLLTAPPYARPDRVDEVVKRSQPRQADPFDLPPPTGSAGPAAPAGTPPAAVTNDTAISPPE